MNLRLMAFTMSMALAALSASTVSAQDPSSGSGAAFPSKPIRIVTSSAGSGNDTQARIFGPGIAAPLGQPVIIDNRGAGIAATEAVSKAPPDGYSILLNGSSAWLAPLLQKVPYDLAREFTPLTLISRETFMVTVHPSLPAKNVKELIALAKARPGDLNYGSGVTASPNHLAVELLKSMTGINIVRVAYKGSAPSITAQLAGEVQVTISDVGLVAPHIKAGKLRALAITSAEPSPLAPGMPTVAASGLPGYEWSGYSGTWVAAKTPAPILNRLNQEIARFLARAEIKERFLGLGLDAVGNTPDEFAAIIRSDIAKTGKVLKDTGIKAE